MKMTKTALPRKHLVHKTIERKTYETVAMLLMVSLLMFVVTFAVLLHRAMLFQSQMTRYVGLIEKYNGDIAAAKTARDLMTLVENHAKLPKDELPLVAQIKDVSKLVSMKEFQSALNGDMALIYENAKKIYIYRQDTDMLVTESDFDSSALDKMKKQEPSPTVSPTGKVVGGPRVLLSSDSAKMASPSADILEKDEKN